MDEVRFNVEVFNGLEFFGFFYVYLNFIIGEEYFVFVGKFFEGFEEVFWWDNVVVFILYWFEEDSFNFVWRNVFEDVFFDEVENFVG